MMEKNNSKSRYNSFHNKTKTQCKIISQKNFTYRNIINIIEKYLKGDNVKVLDIGCGSGTLCFYIANKGNSVFGVDISSKAISTCQESAHILGMKNATFKVIDFPSENINGKFDFIISSEVIEHLEDDNLALKKIYGLLRNNGVLIITTPSSHAPLHRLGYAINFDKRVGHLRRYTIESLSKQCEDIGFMIVEAHKIEGILRNFLFLNPIAGKLVRLMKFYISDLVTFIDNIFIPIFGESNILIVAKKGS